ncbi:hypothetical protein MTYM_01242 [Methylococcales bacterium]|nr:hypothetical protein MTYM_01242 [Methylococcales bacterium]
MATTPTPIQKQATKKPAPAARRTKPAAKQRAKPVCPDFPKDNDALVRLPQVLTLLPIGRTSFLDGVKEGKFPKPIKLGQSSLWKAGDIRQLLYDISKGRQSNWEDDPYQPKNRNLDSRELLKELIFADHAIKDSLDRLNLSESLLRPDAFKRLSENWLAASRNASLVLGCVAKLFRAHETELSEYVPTNDYPYKSVEDMKDDMEWKRDHITEIMFNVNACEYIKATDKARIEAGLKACLAKLNTGAFIKGSPYVTGERQ